MRSRQLIYQEIFREMGGAVEAARILGCAEDTTRSYTEPLERGGREMPVAKVQRVIEYCAARPDRPRLFVLIHELVNDHFAAPGGMRAVPLATVLEAEELFLSLKNSKSYHSIAQRCPECHGPLEVIGKIGAQFVYSCSRGCGRGVGAAA